MCCTCYTFAAWLNLPKANICKHAILPNTTKYPLPLNMANISRTMSTKGNRQQIWLNLGFENSKLVRVFDFPGLVISGNAWKRISIFLFMHEVSHFYSVNIEFGWWWASDEVSCIREQLASNFVAVCSL